MLDFRRFEHVFLCSLIIVAAVVGVTRLVVHLSKPEVQLILAAESTPAIHAAADSVKAAFERPKGSLLVALTPLPANQFGMLPYYIGVGWGRVANRTSISNHSETLHSPTEGVEAANQPRQGSPNSTSAITPDGRVDINLATAEELQTLPGIGPALAARILEMREYRGGFVYPEELLDVSGIGSARYEQLIDRIIVGSLEE